MTLDEIEKLAENVVARDGAFRDNMNELRRIEAISSLLGHGLIAAQHASELARALLVVLPLAREALALYKRAEKCHDRPYMGCSMDHSSIESSLYDGVENLRRSLAEVP